MRMWLVEPTLMCSQHLLGEHVELHMLVGSIRKGNSIAGYVQGGLVDTGQVERRHNQLVTEMTRRGYHHQSPLVFTAKVIEGSVSVQANVVELARRCENCRKLMKLNYDG